MGLCGDRNVPVCLSDILGGAVGDVVVLAMDRRRHKQCQSVWHLGSLVFHEQRHSLSTSRTANSIACSCHGSCRVGSPST